MNLMKKSPRIKNMFGFWLVKQKNSQKERR